MRGTVLGVAAVLGALAVLSLLAVLPGEVFAQRNGAAANAAPPANPGAAAAPADGLVAFSTAVGDREQMLTVVDPKQRSIALYAVDLRTGAIELKSVRNIHWDLQMSEFNGVNPLPRDIRALAEPR